MNTREATTNVELNSDSTTGQLPTGEASQPAALNQTPMPAPVQQPSVATTSSTIPQNVVPYLPYGYGDHFFPAYHYVMPPYGFTPMAPSQQFQPLRPIAPKPQEHSNQPTNRALSRPPDFIETVKILRKQLYDLAGTEESQEPPESQVYSKWRKAVSQEWRPVSMLYFYILLINSSSVLKNVISWGNSKGTSARGSYLFILQEHLPLTRTAGYFFLKMAFYACPFFSKQDNFCHTSKLMVLLAN